MTPRTDFAEAIFALFLAGVVGGVGGYVIGASYARESSAPLLDTTAVVKAATPDCSVREGAAPVKLQLRDGAVMCFVREASSNMCAKIVGHPGYWTHQGMLPCPS